MGSITSALTEAANSLGVLSRHFRCDREQHLQRQYAWLRGPERQLAAAAVRSAGQDWRAGCWNRVRCSARVPEYLEQAVRNQQQFLGSAQQQAGDLGQIQSLFSLTATSGVAPSLNSLFDAFSQLSVSPNDSTNQPGRDHARRRSGAEHPADRVGNSAGVSQYRQPDQRASSARSTSWLRRSPPSISSIKTTRAPAGRRPGRADELGARKSFAARQLHSDQDQRRHQQRRAGRTNHAGDRRIRPMRFRRPTPRPRPTILDSQGNDITSQITQGQLGALIAGKQHDHSRIYDQPEHLRAIAGRYGERATGAGRGSKRRRGRAAVQLRPVLRRGVDHRGEQHDYAGSDRGGGRGIAGRERKCDRAGAAGDHYAGVEWVHLDAGCTGT